MKVNVNLIKGSKVKQKRKEKAEARESRRVASRAPASIVTGLSGKCLRA